MKAALQGVPLSELATPSGVKAGKNSNLPVYSVTKHSGFVPSLEYFNKQVFSRDLSGYKLVEPGELAYATIHLDEGSIGRCPERCLISPMYTTFRVNDQKVDATYLCRFLKSSKALAQYPQLGKGSVERRRAISFERLSRLEIPLPPLAEQRRIAEVLDKAEALRAKRRAALAQLDSLTQSLFLDLFGDPVFNERKWPRLPLSGVCRSPDHIKCGPFGTQLGRDEFRTEGVPLWGIKNVNKLFELPTHEFLEPHTAKRLIQYSIEPGDIVMTRKGTVGNCAVYPSKLPPGIMHSDLLRLRVNCGTCDPIFLSHQLHYSRDVEGQLALISGGAVMPGINVTRLKNLEVLLPPLDLQREFTRRLAVVEKLKTAQRAALAELDTLFASLQHRAFRGEL